jgi:uncharacterized protein (DUF433 family)
MVFPKRTRNYIPAEIVSSAGILGGEPCVAGTRVPAMTIVAELRAGTPESDILDGYPSLPFDAIDAVKAWARENGISIEPAGA